MTKPKPLDAAELARAQQRATEVARRLAGITQILSHTQNQKVLADVHKFLASHQPSLHAAALAANMKLTPVLKELAQAQSSTQQLRNKIAHSLSAFTANTAALQSLSRTNEELRQINAALAGKNSEYQRLIRELGKKREQVGTQTLALANTSKESVAEAFQEKKQELEQEDIEARLASETLDMTLPAAPALQGTVHPVSQVMDELAEIFADLGFSVATGPEIEDDWHNFTALNFPENHPARAMHDSFYLNRMDADGRPMLLRTHTSPVQIRAMQSGAPPLYLIAPGRTYRSDSDATHTPMFHQVEGLVIDRNITLGHLKWTLETFLKAFFERDDIVLRLRPSYFPFTEPSAEVDVGFHMEGGRRVLGGDDHWMELLGSGMVHPRVIANCGLDPEIWQGFAFGCGIDRLAMLKYGMDDLRAFFDGDLRWLRHYGFTALDVPTLSGGVGS